MSEPTDRPRIGAAVLALLGAAAVVMGWAMVQHRGDQLYPTDRLVLGLVIAAVGVAVTVTGLVLAVAARRRP